MNYASSTKHPWCARRDNLLMKTIRQLTAVVQREDDVYVALCPELASQGETVESAKKNLVEALELFFESADPSEISRRLTVYQ